ncbi:MAG: T9SS type A sorting domain-containing protein, partial [Muribaculaceae bacterium]|nr:T9SS type A sorting domain-containing protein [Muribaculaceae bacterium]
YGIGSWVLGYAYEELDFVTGEQLIDPYQISLDEDYMPYYQTAAYNPDTDRIYGYGFVDRYNGAYAWKSANAARPAESRSEKSITDNNEVCLALCYNEAESLFYGINLAHQFVTVDNEGNQTVLFDPGLESIRNVVSALVYSPTDDCYVFNAVLEDGGSELYAIDAKAMTCELLSSVSEGIMYTYFVTPTPNVQPEAPDTPQITAVDFAGGSCDGTFTFVLPSTTYNGNPIAEVQYEVLIDGKIYTESEGKAGDTVSVQMTDIETGRHVFTVRASYEGHVSLSARYAAFIGNDIPVAPSDVRLTLSHLSWSPVTEGIDGGYIDTASMEYEVFMGNEWLGTTTDTFMDIELPEGELAPYVCEVFALCNGRESAGTKSNTVVFGDPLSLDVELGPTEEQAKLFAVFDANNDESTWQLRSTYADGYIFSYYPHPVNSGDDWLMLPPIEFDDEAAVYYFSVEASLGLAFAPNEHFEVWIGEEPMPEAMTIPVMSKTTPSETTFNPFFSYFNVPHSGTWYIGVKAVSEPDQKYLNLKNFNIKKTSITSDVPGIVTDLILTGGEKSALYANVRFTMPLYDAQDRPLSDTALMTAVVTGASVSEVSGYPGQTIETTVETIQGYNTISVVCSLPDTGDGLLATGKVYTGYDKPGYIDITEAIVSEDNMSVTLKWRYPDTGLHGTSLGDYETSYYLCIFNGRIWSYRRIDSDTLSYTYDYKAENPETPLAKVALGIVGENEYGMGDDPADNFVECQLGTPYQLPMVETFAEGAPAYQPLYGLTSGEFAEVSWLFTNPAEINPDFSIEGNNAMVGFTTADKATGRLVLPKFTATANESWGIELVMWTGDDSASCRIMASTSDVSVPVEIGEIKGVGGWQTVSFMLPEEVIGTQWTEIFIEADFAIPSQYAMLAAYTIGSMTGIESVNNSGQKIIASADGVSFNNLDNETYYIYTTDGRLVKTGKICSSVYTLPLDKGMYIIRCGNQTSKVMLY